MNIFNNYIKIEIEGKNINNFIKRLISNKINIYKLDYLSYNKITIIIDYKDYKKIKKIKTIYRIKKIRNYGKLKILEIINKNKILLLSLFIGIVIIFILSNIIFNVEIIHTNKDVIKKVKEELNRYDLKKYKFKKNYEEIEKIEKKILDNNKDLIEWIEIDNKGTKYIVNIEQRKLNKKEEDYIYRDIVASKDALITSIVNSTGEKIKFRNDYVKKDEVIVSGTLLKPSGEKIYLKADGYVLGEVWYKVNIEHPFTYKEEKLTGNSKDVYSIKFLNKKFSLFNYKKFNSFNIKEKVIFNNNIIPISFIKEKYYEVKIVNEIYTIDEVKMKKIDLAKKKIMNNNKIKEIKDIKILNQINHNSKMELQLLICVIEDITKFRKIDTSSDNEIINNS